MHMNRKGQPSKLSNKNSRRKSPSKTKQQADEIITNAHLAVIIANTDLINATMRDSAPERVIMESLKRNAETTNINEDDPEMMDEQLSKLDCTLSHLDTLRKRLIDTRQKARNIDPSDWPAFSHVEHAT